MAISDQAIGDHAIGDASGSSAGAMEFIQGYADFVDAPRICMTLDCSGGVFVADCDIQKMTADL